MFQDSKHRCSTRSNRHGEMCSDVRFAIKPAKWAVLSILQNDHDLPSTLQGARLHLTSMLDDLADELAVLDESTELLR